MQVNPALPIKFGRETITKHQPKAVHLISLNVEEIHDETFDKVTTSLGYKSCF